MTARFMICGVILLIGLQSASAQTTSRASQVVTFSVKSSHQPALAAAAQKITATVDASVAEDVAMTVNEAVNGTAVVVLPSSSAGEIGRTTDRRQTVVLTVSD